jgi:transcriptional regulator with XRE-family HTH domain
MTALTNSKTLGVYLKDRRLRLDPVALGFSGKHRRTSGLRREEVAHRASISTTWYTWLEQGRGGAPSPGVLERISSALMMTEAEREHAFVLGLGHPPDVRYQPTLGITPRLQKILDSMEACPAFIRTATWDIVAWNQAATLLLADYAALPLEQRNGLRLMFLNPQARTAQKGWEELARFVVAAFRADAARAGVAATVQPLVDELSQASPEFAAMWRENDVRGFSEGVKTLYHPLLGELAFEYSAFAVDGRTDLTMLVYTPAEEEDAQRIRNAVRKARTRQRQR